MIISRDGVVEQDSNEEQLGSSTKCIQSRGCYWDMRSGAREAAITPTLKMLQHLIWRNLYRQNMIICDKTLYVRNV